MISSRSQTKEGSVEAPLDHSHHRKAPSLIGFVRTTTRPFDLIWMVVPFLFFALKHASVTTMTREISDEVIRKLSIVWPVLTEQYSAIDKFGADGDAINFAAFCAMAVVVSLFLLGWTVVYYVRRHSTIEVVRSDVILTAILCYCSSFVLLFDNVKENPTPVWEFYVDPLGLYYFRQIIMPYMVWFTLSALILLALETLKKLKILHRDSRGV